MKHNLHLRVSKTRSNESIVSCRAFSIREKFLSKLCGSKRKVTVLIPGDSVGTLTITGIDDHTDDLKRENEEPAVDLNPSEEFWSVRKYNEEKHMGWSEAQCQAIDKQMEEYCRANGFEIRTEPADDAFFPPVNVDPVAAWNETVKEEKNERTS